MKNAGGYRDTTTKRGQNLLALARSPADNDPLVLSAPRVISFRFPVARAIGSPLSYVLIPVIFPAIDRWFSVPFSRSPIGDLCAFRVK